MKKPTNDLFNAFDEELLIKDNNNEISIQNPIFFDSKHKFEYKKCSSILQKHNSNIQNLDFNSNIKLLDLNEIISYFKI